MILFRYLAKEVLLSLLAVSVTLLVIVMSSRFVKYLAQAASGDLAPEMVLAIMFYRMPSFLELVLPLGLFIAILLTYGRLYVESEMTVMSACGLSTKRLVFYTLIPAFMVAALVAWLTLYASPVGIAKVEEIFQEAKNSSTLDLVVAGQFRVDEKSGHVTYIQQLTPDRQAMDEVFFAEQSVSPGGKIELAVILAERGRLEFNEDYNARYLVLNEGYQYIGEPGGRAYRVTAFDEFGQLLEDSESQRKSYKKSDSRSTEQLLASERLEDKATLQWRLSLVLLVPVIALIAQALSKTNHRRGRYVKMLPAFLIYIIYLVILNAARDAIEKEKLSLMLGMWWIHILFFMLALGLLFGGDCRQRLRHSSLRKRYAEPSGSDRAEGDVGSGS